MQNANIFNSVQVKRPPHTKFPITHSNRFTTQMGILYLAMAEPMVPGSYAKLETHNLIRFPSLSAPVMETFDVTFDYFYVPDRYTFKGTEDFHTGKKPVTQPTMVRYSHELAIPRGSIVDMLGLPLTMYDAGAADFVPTEFSPELNTEVLMTFFAAYQKIWFDWYRDQNHQYPEDDWNDSWRLNEGQYAYNSPNPEINKYFQVRKKAWTHDYFTSALPWPQRGDAVAIPMGTMPDVPVYNAPNTGTMPTATQYKQVIDNDALTAGDAQYAAAGGGAYSYLKNPTGELSWIDTEASGHMARTSEITIGAATIDELNKAYRIQEWLQLSARTGQRYVEYVLGNFGEYTEDYRLERAQFVGSYTQPLVVSEVLQTSGNQELDPNGFLGDMGGRVITASNGKVMRYKAKEHGILMCIMYVMPRAAYTQGIDKKFRRLDKFEYIVPLLGQIGEQPIYNSELMVTTNDKDNNAVFGYGPRYSDWKYGKSIVAGEFRDTLDDWQYSRKFANPPALNADFLTYSNDNRIFNYMGDDADHIYTQLIHYIDMVHPLPMYGTPVI